MTYVKYLLLLVLLIISDHVKLASSANDDLYVLLGVAKTATTREIRQAFKKLALEKHPDKNQVCFGILPAYCRIERNRNVYFRE